jgi:hypothetical protein
MKRYLSLLLCLVLLLTLCACSGEKAPQGPTVSIRVEGISENLAYDAKAPLKKDASALALVCALLDKLDIPYDTDAGYLTAVGHDKAGAFAGWDGFVFYRNGEESLAAPDAVQPQAGDVLLFCYADLSGEPPTLMPKIEAVRGSDGLVTLTVLGGKLTFQGDTPVMEYAPVAEAEVTVNEVLYYTDAAGKLVLDKASSQKKRVSMQVEHYTEDGRPLLIRLEPGFELELPQ